MTDKKLLGCFLVAAPALKDPIFSKTVILIVNQEEKMGVIGLVINRELDLTISKACERLKFPCRIASGEQHLGWGGPVAGTRGFIVHSPAQEDDVVLLDHADVAVASSTELLSRIVEGTGPEKYLVVLGCAGWLPGQLQSEIAAGAWLVAPWSERIAFDLPADERYDAALVSVGVDDSAWDSVPPAFRMMNAGHA